MIILQFYEHTIGAVVLSVFPLRNSAYFKVALRRSEFNENNIFATFLCAVLSAILRTSRLLPKQA